MLSLYFSFIIENQFSNFDSEQYFSLHNKQLLVDSNVWFSMRTLDKRVQLYLDCSLSYTWHRCLHCSVCICFRLWFRSFRYHTIIIIIISEGFCNLHSSHYVTRVIKCIGRWEMHGRAWPGRSHLRDLGIHGNNLLKYISVKQDVIIWKELNS